RKENLAQKIIEAVGKGKKVAVLGLTFKPDTDDLRESPALTILPMLNAAGISIAAYDPQGMKIAKAQMPFLQLGDDPYSTMKGADALVILTEWNEFKALDWDRVRENLKAPLVIDLRNIYEPDEVAGQGFTYISVGRPIARPLKAAVKLVKG
ncbi:MAG: UDP binding domain-containing protein, partial [Dongiaceae bacterium]